MNLDDLEQGLIQAARRDLGPSLADRERHELLLATTLHAPSSTGVAPGGSSVSRGLRVKLLGAGMVVGAVIGGWVGFSLGRSLPAPTAAERPPAPELIATASPRAPSPAPAERQTFAVDESLAARLAESPAPGESGDAQPGARELPGGDVVRAAAAPRRAKRSASTREESSLAVELAMLQRARRALNAGNGRLALGIVQELDERFPKGVLIEERRATRVLSLCLLERTEEAQRFAAEFEERHSGSVYAQRVRESCVADAPE